MTLRKRTGAGPLGTLGPRRATTAAAAAIATVMLAAACSSSSSSTASTSASSTTSASTTGATTIGVDLTYNDTAFWAAYINYETQYAAQLHIHLLGPLLAAANASLQNTQIETLVNEGAKAIIVNPETATSLGPAISYAAAHHVQLISVDTIVGVGKVYMVVRASNILYGMDACAYISSQVNSGYVLDLEGDLTSSNGADRTNAFDACMAANDPGVHVLKDPTVQSQPANLYAYWALASPRSSRSCPASTRRTRARCASTGSPPPRWVISRPGGVVSPPCSSTPWWCRA